MNAPSSLKEVTWKTRRYIHICKEIFLDIPEALPNPKQTNQGYSGQLSGAHNPNTVELDDLKEEK